MSEFSSPIDIGLAGSPFSAPEELQDEFQKVYNAIRILQQELGKYAGLGVLDPNNYLNTITPVFADSIQIHRMTPIIVQASVAIGAGNLVNLFNSAGTIKARLADATAIGTRAHGWVNEAININDRGIVYLWDGISPNWAALAVGQTYYLSAATPGGIVNAPPLAVGTIRQEVGLALTATDLVYHISTPIVN